MINVKLDSHFNNVKYTILLTTIKREEYKKQRTKEIREENERREEAKTQIQFCGVDRNVSHFNEPSLHSDVTTYFVSN